MAVLDPLMRDFSWVVLAIIVLVIVGWAVGIVPYWWHPVDLFP